MRDRWIAFMVDEAVLEVIEGAREEHAAEVYDIAEKRALMKLAGQDAG